MNKMKFQYIHKIRKVFGARSCITGFTLLEMVVSIGIFSVVIVATIGLMLSISSAQIKAANIQAVQDNIRFGLELLTKEIRTGSNLSTAGSCGPAGSRISFDATSGRRVYFWDAANLLIMRAKQNITSADCDGTSGRAVPFSAEDVFIDRFQIETQGIGAAGSDDGQPMITVSLRARSKTSKIQLESAMDIQTTVTPRLRDLQ